MIRFKCPTCDQSFEAESSQAGRTMTCEVCRRTFEIPSTNSIFPPSDLGPEPSRVEDPAPSERKSRRMYCIDCGETIDRDVSFCPECGAEQRTGSSRRRS